MISWILQRSRSVCKSVCCMHMPLGVIACLTRGRGDDRVVCLASNSPRSHHTLYTHTPLALFKATHSCGNVSIVTAWTLYGQQLGAGIWAEELVSIWACARLCVCACVWLILCRIWTSRDRQRWNLGSRPSRGAGLKMESRESFRQED